MPKQNSIDPFESLHKFSLLWEKQINDFLYFWTNNEDFVKVTNLGTEVHSRHLERFKRNQQAFASFLNLPTKNDVTNVAHLTIQTEERIEALEEEMWDIKDTLKMQSKEIQSVLEASKEMIKFTKQIKMELGKAKKELLTVNSLSAQLQEIKQELLELTRFKEEEESGKDIDGKEEAIEPVVTAAGS